MSDSVLVEDLRCQPFGPEQSPTEWLKSIVFRWMVSLHDEAHEGFGSDRDGPRLVFDADGETFWVPAEGDADIGLRATGDKWIDPAVHATAAAQYVIDKGKEWTAGQVFLACTQIAVIDDNAGWLFNTGGKFASSSDCENGTDKTFRMRDLASQPRKVSDQMIDEVDQALGNDFSADWIAKGEGLQLSIVGHSGMSLNGACVRVGKSHDVTPRALVDAFKRRHGERLPKKPT